MIKLNKTQIEALVSKIKNNIKKEIDKEMKELREAWTPTEKQKIILKDYEEAEKFIKEFNNKYWDGNRYYKELEFKNYDLEGIKHSMIREYVDDNSTKYDTSNLHNDIVLKTLEVDNIQELIDGLIDGCRL